MMRTPTVNAKTIVRSDSFQIGSIPPTPKSRRIVRNASQISNILNNHSMSPVQTYPNANKKNDAPNLLKAETGMALLNSVSSFNRTGAPSGGRDFCKDFFGWLKIKESEFDAVTFANLKGELYQLIGKYELVKIERN